MNSPDDYRGQLKNRQVNMNVWCELLRQARHFEDQVRSKLMKSILNAPDLQNGELASITHTKRMSHPTSRVIHKYRKGDL